MRKAEKDARTRQSNSKAILNTVSRLFSERSDLQTSGVYPIHSSSFDWQELERSIYPICRLQPPGGAAVSFIYFKRRAEVPDLEWSELYRLNPIYKP